MAPKEGEINMGLLLSGDGKIVANDMERAKVPGIGLPNFSHWLSLPMCLLDPQVC